LLNNNIIIKSRQTCSSLTTPLTRNLANSFVAK